uniref:Uncharacterized protein n=1 Tax=Lepeophtheirus salmonis TaxID=72036 RepID=A0A0K2TRM0_LEPSM
MMFSVFKFLESNK